MEQFAAYNIAIGCVALFALITLILGPVAASAKMKEGVVSGAQPKADYSSRTYRLWRAHLNASEMLGVFIASVVVAMLAAVSPWWVNLLAAVFILSRVVHAIVHINGIGAENFGPRSISFTIGWLACGVLVLLALLKVWFGVGF